jgi:hypothetical protein
VETLREFAHASSARIYINFDKFALRDPLAERDPNGANG